ncbi:GntR family transcriptional regulator [Tritonibacter horizontis]|uniref:HTH-type transcriptional regulator McbR n=1 Tax=Tritonibacter horizontis TaxID=1768241 RepID=A0A132BUR0_9RHOB|nr:GntR family transcriptional regulator [Tritonibacter horizontis]KUP92024.1 HTH-type transcriptional regulator McbR [Tritonibacter horizontis]
MATLSLATNPSAPTTTTDQAFEALYEAIVSFELPPGTKVSEIEIAKQMEISRQPVRDAFFRLSKLGFLLIRPQRATLITKISVEAVEQAAFVRLALELACVSEAIQKMDDAGLAQIDEVIARQQQAVQQKDGAAFHIWDDRFHRTICEIIGRAHVWELIRGNKAHVDRVRFLSLPFSLDIALNEHIGIRDALAAKDETRARDLMRAHLLRILRILGQIRDENAEFFEDAPE